MKKEKFMALGLALAVALASGSAFAGDAKKGAKEFKKCKTCHIVKNGAGKNGVGPNLAGVVGKQQGTAEGYTKYMGLKGSTKTWSEDELHLLLIDSSKYLGKSMMKVKVKDKDDRDNLIAYLKTIK